MSRREELRDACNHSIAMHRKRGGSPGDPPHVIVKRSGKAKRFGGRARLFGRRGGPLATVVGETEDGYVILDVLAEELLTFLNSRSNWDSELEGE